MFVWFIFNAYIIELTLLRSGLILIIGSPIHSSIANVIHMYINKQSKTNLRLNQIYSLNPLHSPIGPYLQSYMTFLHYITSRFSIGIGPSFSSVSQPYRSIGVSVSSAPAYRFPLGGRFIVHFHDLITSFERICKRTAIYISDKILQSPTKLFKFNDIPRVLNEYLSRSHFPFTNITVYILKD